MNQKQVKQLLTHLTTALACTAACTAVIVGNPSSVISATEEMGIVQHSESPEEGNDRTDNNEPGISPQNNKDNKKIKVDPTGE